MNKTLFQEAQKYIIGGVNSPVRAFKTVGQTPRFITHAKGSRIYDADSHEYIDYVMSWGPCILGHAPDRVVEAVKKACEGGLTFGAPTQKETELAKLICQAFPAIERVRLVSSGTEAVMSAIRVARGFTGWDKIIKFRGCYHGHSDGLLVKAGSGLLTGSVPDSAGVPAGYAENTLLADYNDIASVQALFKAQGNSIAAVVVEPVAANMGVVPPKAGFLKSLRNITAQYGALLIFDEVITGFRLAYGGACQYFGIKPDLVTLGKIVGGGMPLAAYGGREDVMQVVAPVGSVYQAGTLSGNPVAVAAGIETLRMLQEKDIYPELEQKAKALEEAYKEKGLAVNRIGSLISAFFTHKTVENYADVMTSDTQAFARYFAHMLEHGIYMAPSQFEAIFLSAAHSDSDIEKTISAIHTLKEDIYEKF